MYQIEELDALFNHLSDISDQCEIEVELYICEELVDTVLIDVNRYIDSNQIDYTSLWDDTMLKIVDALERELPGWYEDYFPRQLMNLITTEINLLLNDENDQDQITASDKALINNMIEELLWEDEERGIEYQMNELIG